MNAQKTAPLGVLGNASLNLAFEAAPQQVKAVNSSRGGNKENPA